MPLKIAILLVVGCLIYRWASGKWPWAGTGAVLTGKPTRSQALFNARKILTVGEDADRAQILAAHKRLISIVHPDKGGSNAQVHEANDARDLLLAELPEDGADVTRDPDE